MDLNCHRCSETFVNTLLKNSRSIHTSGVFLLIVDEGGKPATAGNSTYYKLCLIYLGGKDVMEGPPLNGYS